MFRAGMLTRLAGALFFDCMIHVLGKADDWACGGDEKFTDIGFDIYCVISAHVYMILDGLREYCLNGHVNIRGYVNDGRH